MDREIPDGPDQQGQQHLLLPREHRGGDDQAFREIAAREAPQVIGARRLRSESAGHFLAELNAIHPFREGNGRTLLAFLTILADKAGHQIDTERMNPGDIMQAMIASFGGQEAPLAKLIRTLIEPRGNRA